MSHAKKFLRADGTARTRDGRVVRALEDAPEPRSPYVLCGIVSGDNGALAGATWTSGGHILGDYAEHESDLVLRSPKVPRNEPFPEMLDAVLDREAEVLERTPAAAERKAAPIVTGVLDYFPLALLEVAKCSKQGNEQHHPGTPLHWDRAKSTDEADALGRHLLDRGKFDTDGIRHSAKVAWRALALLQKELEQSKKETL